MNDRFLQTFKEESRELLSELESALLELEAFPADSDLIGRVFRSMHTIKSLGASFGYHDIAQFTHEIETVFDAVRNGKLGVSRELIDLTLQAHDRIGAMLEGTGKTSLTEVSAYCDSFKRFLGTGTADAASPSLPPDPATTTEIWHDDFIDYGTAQKPFIDPKCKIPPESGLAATDLIVPETRETSPDRLNQQDSRTNEPASSIRVPAAKLDTLVDLAGELVTAEARLSRIAQFYSDPRLSAVAEEVERLANELRDHCLSIRMMPIGESFGKFRRLVRDLSSELGKEVELVTAGEETELDKNVMDKLLDPLVHIIRNCMDHGIERPEVRLAGGKSRTGIIVLTAGHAEGNAVITVRDDGAGLDIEAIRARGIRDGLIDACSEPEERELYPLIFAPGFTTAEQVTGVSGRGVGMDVVKRGIDDLRGSIEISSRQGMGTTVKIRLPLTLAIIESLLVKIGNESYILPLSVVEECCELVRDTAESAREGRMANVRGSLIPYIVLRDRFMLPGEPPVIEQIVITRVDGNQVGLVVDKVVGGHQAVIKTLGKTYRNVRGITGATILGDGGIAMILDVPDIVSTEKDRCAGKIPPANRP